MRRVAEVSAIVIALPVVLTVSLIAAVLVAAESKGGVLYAQLRPGKNGRLFRMYKIRTMYSNTGEDKLAVDNDRRITRVGRQLRKYRIDEIPQLWNVLKGDMSLIGPRPVPHNFYRVYLEKLPGYENRHIIRPGITGLAQVRQGYTNTLEEEWVKMRYDLFYISRISLRMDLSIVWGTLLNIARGRK
ncbi:MAG TPA: sugar transferase [Chitinophagaceae bacterium]|nr:sugar transferase [Chitinophagaceae bacterium]